MVGASLFQIASVGCVRQPTVCGYTATVAQGCVRNINIEGCVARSGQ
jgi:hypothetical protein